MAIATLAIATVSLGGSISLLYVDPRPHLPEALSFQSFKVLDSDASNHIPMHHLP